MSYYKRFNKNEHIDNGIWDKEYRQYKTLDGAIVGNDAEGEFVLVKTESVDEFVITVLSRDDFRNQGYYPDDLSDEEMQTMADQMAHNYIQEGDFFDEIDGFAAAYQLETYESDDEE